MAILMWIIVGGIAGFLASKLISGKGMGLLADIGVGILGAFLGGWLAGLAGISVNNGTFTVGGIVAAFVGALLLLVAFRSVTKRGRVHV
jgi:uncharacterized membrane protein YeaQ/YmgE (transglycosylase-associated protein family)